MRERAHRAAWITTIVAALGYLVDVYDLVLFSVVRVPSLQSLGLSPEQVHAEGVFLLNTQMAGMLVGGVAWGVLGDRIGRCAVLFGSIACYSLANIANAFVLDVTTYALVRFVAGVGLAGELGAGTTLAVELLPAAVRGYGTTLIATVGVAGAVFASLIAGLVDWRWSYGIGGVLGLLLLAARIGTHESMLLHQVDVAQRRVGRVVRLLFKPRRLVRLVACVLVGVPIWFAIGVLITFAPELSREMYGGAASPRYAVLWAYSGFVLGDLLSGLVSQMLKSRKRALFLFMTAGCAASGGYLWLSNGDVALYRWAFCIGISMGYWAVLVTAAAEQFGTNIRATVATTVPNFIRGAVIPLTIVVGALRPMFPAQGLLLSTSVVGIGCYLGAVGGLMWLKETFGVSLDYVEED